MTKQEYDLLIGLVSAHILETRERKDEGWLAQIARASMLKSKLEVEHAKAND
jgi:hypothetical protein